ncbi:MAG: helix-turn-helix domain-containing protein [Synergistaceae bacterium]|nr:helix-turn-helix domain-containing protein [Synergistaceae bacterium]
MDMAARAEKTLFVTDVSGYEKKASAIKRTNALLLIGEPDEKTIPDDIDYIVIDASHDLIEVFTYVQGIFIQLQGWTKELQQALFHKESLENLCLIGQKLIKNSIVVERPDFQCFAFTPESDQSGPPMSYDSRNNTYSLKREVIRDFLEDPAFKNILNGEGLLTYHSEEYDHNAISRNVFFEGHCIARIVIGDTMNPFTQGTIELCRYFTGIIEYALQNYALPQECQDEKDFRDFIIALKNGEAFNRQAVSSYLNSFGWEMRDQYLCLSLSPMKADLLQHSIDYFRLLIYNVLGFGKCIVFDDKREIVIVVNLTLHGGPKEVFLSRFTPFVRDNMFYAGVSKSFSDFYEIALATKESDIALSMGSKLGQLAGFYFMFEDYALTYMQKICTSELPCDRLIPAGLQKLIDHDREKDVKYVTTLSVFLRNESNYTLTAKKLGISRSVLIDRLRRITKLTGEDFKNAETRIYYLWSMYLLEYNFED